MPPPEVRDPFAHHRDGPGVLEGQVAGEEFLMVLGYDELRAVASDWAVFSSDAPFRVPIPSEEGVRNVRQLPIETNPPQHTAYRAVVQEPFSWRTSARIRPGIRQIADDLLAAATGVPHVDLVLEFALPLQSRALALMLGRSQDEAAEWISWGTRVLREGDEEGGLDQYLDRVIDAAMLSPGEDFFGRLATATLDGRRLTREEIMGFANLAFAGGRDTVINIITCAVHHLAVNPADMARLRGDPGLLPCAIEEFLRYFSPIGHIGRVVAEDAVIGGRPVSADSVVSLCFASANRDPRAFDRPNECLVDRSPNRHVAFGHGPHRCIGAPQAKTVLSVALEAFLEHVGEVRVLEARPRVEDLGSVQRISGFERLALELRPA
ncbi:MAG: cytochrome P450 [Candidatus Dormibacteria bacterium]